MIATDGRLAARLRAAGAIQSEGRHELSSATLPRRASRLADPAAWLLRMVASAVALGARKVTVDASRYGTTFTHDGACPGGEDLADLLLGTYDRPSDVGEGDARQHRERRGLDGLAQGLEACLSLGATVELDVKQDETVVHAKLTSASVEVDPRQGGRFASPWSMRVVARGAALPFGRDVALVRERCTLAPVSMTLDERIINVAQHGGPPLRLSELVRGRAVVCLLPPPFFAGCYARDRHVVEIRWLPDALGPGGVGLPQPATACLTLERAWNEQTWPLLDDPARIRPDAERNRFRRSFLVPVGEDQRRIGVFQGVVALRPGKERPSRYVLVMDGVQVEEGELDGEIAGIDAVLAVDALSLDPSTLRPERDAAYTEMMDALRRRAQALDRVLAFEFEGAGRDTRVAHALSGRRGARVLRW